MKILKSLLPFVGLIAIFSFASCLIEDVIQPEQLNAGEVFTATLTISDMNAEQNNAHKGVLAILVPDDWTFISGTYTSPMGFGNLELDPSATPLWGNIDTVIQRPEGMKWINLLTDVGYLHNANVVYEATVNLQVGQKGGDFPIGYLVTVNTIDMLKFLNDQDVDQQLAGTDTSMNHMVKVVGASDIEHQVNNIPDAYSLSQNYPNPFNPSTSFTYSLKKPGDVQIVVYDAAGNKIRNLVNGFRDAGTYTINFDASYVSGLPSGVYYYRIITSEFIQTNKMILIK
ncbi:MAG: T9SS type A sorting domain-containing protein [Ignavibacteriaceae bacterium]|nr:T9SS type A sorting domain-containing protein [Ignavibacteriaceae bacterium]